MSAHDAAGAGRALAERHRAAERAGGRASLDRGRSLLRFSEVPYGGDWSLRSALCRLAQPEPVRVGRVLASVRRLEAVLRQTQKPLEGHPAICHRDESGYSDGSGYVDVRCADVARLIESGHDGAAVIDGYGDVEGVDPLTAEERAALPVLAVAARFEGLALILTEWARQGPANRPVEAVDRACDEIEARLDALAVPDNSDPAPRRARSRR